MHISAFANRQLHPFTLGMTDIYVIKSDPDVFIFQNSITITGVHFVDIQSAVVMESHLTATNAFIDMLTVAKNSSFHFVSALLKWCY